MDRMRKIYLLLILYFLSFNSFGKVCDLISNSTILYFDPVDVASIENDSLRDSWQIFSNPSKELFIVQFNQKVKDLKLSVYDVAGTCLLKAELNNMSTYYIDMAEYSNGTYFIQVSNGKEIINKKVITNSENSLRDQ